MDLMGHDIKNMNQIALGYLELANDILEANNTLGKEDQLLLTKPMETLINNSNLISNVRKLQKEKAGGYKTESIEVDKMLDGVVSRF